jgi:hypothetical protein
VSDEQICAALSEHLCLDGAPAFARPSRLAASNDAKSREQVLRAVGPGSDLRLPIRASSVCQMKIKSLPLQKPRTLTLDDFVTRMASLLDMERDAEVAQVHTSFLCTFPFSTAAPFIGKDSTRTGDAGVFARCPRSCAHSLHPDMVC